MDMCPECPHRREIEVGDSILVVLDGSGKMRKTAHSCHMVPSQQCEGHCRSLAKIRANVTQVEDFQDIRKVYIQ